MIYIIYKLIDTEISYFQFKLILLLLFYLMQREILVLERLYLERIYPKRNNSDCKKEANDASHAR